MYNSSAKALTVIRQTEKDSLQQPHFSYHDNGIPLQDREQEGFIQGGLLSISTMKNNTQRTSSNTSPSNQPKNSSSITEEEAEGAERFKFCSKDMRGLEGDNGESAVATEETKRVQIEHSSDATVAFPTGDPLTDFLLSSPHQATRMLAPQLHKPKGVGSVRLRTGLGTFVMEAYALVQLGSFHWSEEYLGLTDTELVFVKPPSRFGFAKRIVLPLQSVISVHSVEDDDLPFLLPNIKAFAICTFSRSYLVMIRGEDMKSIWVDVLSDAVESCRAEGRERTYTSGSITCTTATVGSSGGGMNAPHLDLLVRSKGFNLASDQSVLNAR